MTQMNCMELLKQRQEAGFFVCVGLDSDTDHAKFPPSVKRRTIRKMIYDFNKKIIDATADISACYKANIAFYEKHGPDGLLALLDTIEYVQHQYPFVPIIVDAKRGDIDNTNSGYVDLIFGFLQADAITVPPYMGGKSLAKFFENPAKAAFVLAKTSNKGADEFQDLEIVAGPGTAGRAGLKLHEVVAINFATQWNTNNNIGLVAGATNEGLERIRQLVGPRIQILIPGVGAQGGSLEGAVRAASQGGSSAFVINSSRGVIFASSNEDFPKAARTEVEHMNATITEIRERLGV